MSMSNGFVIQRSEFLQIFKSRFVQIPQFMGMYGKCGYSCKWNRQDINSSLQVFIPENIPSTPPLLQVSPWFKSPIIDLNGKVIDDCLWKWNYNSNWTSCVNEVLGKWEGRIPIYSANPNLDLNSTSSSVSMNTNIWNKSNEESIINDWKSEWNKKEIEELIYINYNPNHYISKFTEAGRIANATWWEEVKRWNLDFENMKSQYNVIKTSVENCKEMYEEKEKELNQLFNKKKSWDSQITVDKLIFEMNNYIETNFKKPKQAWIDDFLNNRIDNETFQNKFKVLSMNFHYYTIVRDKLKLCL